MICGGIDLGGTKIEARLFQGRGIETVATRRLATPKDSYGAFLDTLIDQITWLTDQAGQPDLPIGIAVPGILNPDTGIVFAANIVGSGHAIGADLERRCGLRISLCNDCMAFALSEANGGAGQGYQTVMGLILGTGVGGGLCHDQRLLHRHGGLAVEIGHVAASASAIARHDLPIVPCGCGRKGCLETYVSGTGISNIAEHVLGTRLSAQDLVDQGQTTCLDIWADIAGDALATIQLTLAPDCIVLGGGVSNMIGITDRLSQSLARHTLPTMALPDILIAAHGDSSGARGAALMALEP